MFPRCPKRFRAGAMRPAAAGSCRRALLLRSSVTHRFLGSLPREEGAFCITGK